MRYQYSSKLGDYYPSAKNPQLICRDKSECRCNDSGSCTVCKNHAGVLLLDQNLANANITVISEDQWRLDCKCDICSHVWNTSKGCAKKLRSCPKCALKSMALKNSKFYTLEELQGHLPEKIKVVDWIDNQNIRVSCLSCNHEWDKHYLWAIHSQKACPKCFHASLCKWNIETVTALFIKDGRSSQLEVLSWPLTTNGKATFRCKQCTNEWQGKAEDYVLKKTGCPQCNINRASRVQTESMRIVEQQLGITFDRHSGNSEYSILNPKSKNSRFRADGYSTATDTVFEFHGDAYHGNLNRYAPDANPNYFAKHLTTQELYDQTILREDYIKSLGYRLIVWWELDYRNDRAFSMPNQITIGNAFVAIRDGMNLEQLKANLIAENRKSEVSVDAGLQEVLWKYPSLKREAGFAEVSKEIYQVRILEATQHYVLFECEDDRYITRSLT
ncbi:zinc-ribbon domain-containing protein [Yersinia ruckeri]|uniref:zinc-ribbon domain-containing protein n=1 Tax=Yersinia ruckeri TaxID=29486 RepID=UPI0022370D7C|nr:hypothetical protein [Yersinia ruckeri]MCW6598627.1 hypothetical protein [Yersinia ruckeri]